MLLLNKLAMYYGKSASGVVKGSLMRVGGKHRHGLGPGVRVWETDNSCRPPSPLVLQSPPTNIKLLLLSCAACAVPVPSLVTTIQLIFALVVVYSMQVRLLASPIGPRTADAIPLKVYRWNG
jgi:hypothetical protein